jgi:3alpha(or 20beta)-hydroxysteroid dehydrogenase
VAESGRVEGKVVVVTGAAGGQGEAEALALAREGATVVATDLAAAPPAYADEAERIAYRQLDVADPGQWAALGAWLAGEHGRVDGLVNNAGIPFRARLHEVALADWDRVLAVNVTGSLLGIQTVLPLMPSGGSIVNVSSAAGLTGHYAAAYTVSKWAVRGLSRVASLELGERGIRVNTIFPGFIETPMTASAPDAFREANIAATPLARTGSAQEVAPLVVYLVSDESAFVSGAEITVDGGLTAHAGAKSLSDAVRSAT